MYGWFWNHLPGPVPVRILLALAIFALIVVLLFLYVFPLVDSWLPFDESNVDAAAQSVVTLPS